MTNMEALAHGPGHLLRDHLLAVGELAAAHSPASLAPWARLAGLWHDLGKFRPGFQQYIRIDAEAHLEGHAMQAPQGRNKTHSAAGALHALQVLTERWGPGAAAAARPLIYAIAGHHAGLDNWFGGEGGGLDPRLFGGGRVDAGRELDQALAECRRTDPDLLCLPADFDLRAACAAIPGLAPKPGRAPEPLAASLWIRMLFSALVDADFLDTEAYFDIDRPSQRAVAHPQLTRDDILAALAFAAERMREESYGLLDRSAA